MRTSKKTDEGDRVRKSEILKLGETNNQSECFRMVITETSSRKERLTYSRKEEGGSAARTCASFHGEELMKGSKFYSPYPTPTARQGLPTGCKVAILNKKHFLEELNKIENDIPVPPNWGHKPIHGHQKINVSSNNNHLLILSLLRGSAVYRSKTGGGHRAKIANCICRTPANVTRSWCPQKRPVRARGERRSLSGEA